MNSIAASEFVMVFLTIIILYAVCKYFWNLLSELKKSNHYLEAQTKLIAEFVVRNGVEVDTVSDIIAQSGIKKIKL